MTKWSGGTPRPLGDPLLLRLLRTYLGPYRRVIAAVLVLQVIQTIAGLLLPRLNADIIDRGVVGNDHPFIWSTGKLMLGITLIQVGCAIGAVYFGARVAMGIGRDIRSGVFHQVCQFSAREMGHFGASSLITRITNDALQVQVFVAMLFTMMVGAPITAIGGVAMAVREDSGLPWILAVSIPVLVASLGFVVYKMVPQFRLMQIRIDGINRVLREQITGIRVIRAFVREPAEARRFEQVNADITETALRAGRLQAATFPIVIFVLNVSSVAVIWVGAGRISHGQMKIGAMIAFLNYLIQVLMAVMMATFMVGMIPRATVCAERIVEVLDTPTSVVPPSAPVTEVPEHSALELRNVGFHYPGAEAPVLTNVSLRSIAGQTTAIIGSTGSGKTTLLGLIPRLFDATSGSVLVDGIDVRELDPNTLWGRIGLVPQKPYLFSGTVATNLRFAKPEATDDELWEALTIAQAADFVAAMPGGLHAEIAQGGSNVSGGQRQRLAIARALVRRPEIYLFDDSFSALDLATDARLRAAIAPHIADATVLVVAQRVSTIRDADQIVVLEDGEVVGAGTYADLLEICPTFVEIVQSQLSAQDAA